MATPAERNWTAHIVISSDHAGLRTYFKHLETEMLRVLARVDNPTMVKVYVMAMSTASKAWLAEYEELAGEK